jgi:hypothetical protein
MVKAHPISSFSLIPALALLGCNIGVSASRIQAAEPATPVDGSLQEVPLSAVGGEVCPNGVQVAADGLIDDLEDGNTQVDMGADRDGYWWTTKDPVGSTLEPSEGFAPVAGGPEGSNQAIHVRGTTATGDQAWGAGVGFNLSSAGLYDASRYVGVRFKIRVEPNTTKRVRFKIGDVNTHEDAGVCDSCWNHFGKDLTLTEHWQQYTLFFKELTQAPGWGKPRPPVVTAAQLYSMDISIDKGQTFDIWLDEFQFVECKK